MICIKSKWKLRAYLARQESMTNMLDSAKGQVNHRRDQMLFLFSQNICYTQKIMG